MSSSSPATAPSGSRLKYNTDEALSALTAPHQRSRQMVLEQQTSQPIEPTVNLNVGYDVNEMQMSPHGVMPSIKTQEMGNPEFSELGGNVLRKNPTMPSTSHGYTSEPQAPEPQRSMEAPSPPTLRRPAHVFNQQVSVRF